MLDAGLLNDADPQVRLAALLALAEMPADRDGRRGDRRALLAEPENVDDRWLPDAADQRRRRARREPSSRPSPARSELARRGCSSRRPSSPSTTPAAARRDRSARCSPRWPTAEPAIAEAILAGLAKGWPTGKAADARPTQAEKALAELLAAAVAGRQAASCSSSRTRWGSKALREARRARSPRRCSPRSTTTRQPTPSRVAAARQLVELRPDDDDVVDEAARRSSRRARSPELAAGLLDALGGSRGDGRRRRRRRAARRADRRPREPRRCASLLAPAESTQALLDAVDKGKVQLGDLSLDQKQALAAHPDTADRRAGQEAARARRRPAQRRPAEGDRGAAAAHRRRPATPTAGKVVFKKQCAKCHTHGGEGDARSAPT